MVIRHISDVKNNSSKILNILIILSLVFCFLSCNDKKDTKVGSGITGKIEAFDWSRYDKLIDQCKKEVNQDKRNELLYEAENMLLDSGAVIPLVGAQTQYLCRDNIKDFYITFGGTPIAKFASSKDNKKELRMSICGKIDTFDAAKSSSMESGTIVENYQGNLYYKTDEGIKKELASDLDISKDKLTYTIKIKKEAKWSDGMDVTADDFVYTWKRASKKENKTDYGYMFEAIDGYPNNLNIKAIDKKTFKVKLKQPSPYFKQLLSNSFFSPVRKDVVENTKGYKDNDGNVVDEFAWGKQKPTVSCGAFTIESWDDSSIVLKKNPKYIFADKVKVKKIYLKLSNDANSIYQAYQAGDVDVDTDLHTDEIAELRDRRDFKIKKSQEMSYIFFSLKAKIFEGMTVDEAKKFRRAIGHAIDRDTLSNKVLMGNDLSEGRIIPSTVHDGTGKKYIENIYKIENNIFKYNNTKDLDKSRELLKKIGYEFDDRGKLKEKIVLEYLYYETGNYKNVVSSLKSDLNEIGIELDLKKYDVESLSKKKETGDFQATRGRWIPDYDDPMSFLEIFTTNNSLNCSQLGRLE